MKYMKYIAIFILAALISACANNDYQKTPPPCSSFTASFSGSSHDCGPMRPINF